MKKLKNNFDGCKATKKTLFKIKIKNNTIYAKFIAKNSKLYSFSNKDNDSLWKGDVCELFLDFGYANKYLEIEVAPNGTIFLAEINRISKEIYFLDTSIIKAKAKKYLDGYIVEIELSLDKFEYTTIFYNAYRIETNGNSKEQIEHYALNPTHSKSFHDDWCFIKLI